MDYFDYNNLDIILRFDAGDALINVLCINIIINLNMTIFSQCSTH